MKKVLIITYYWPPSGGAGVQRWLKFTKYLREFGWEPVIYTPENPEAPAIDHSLEKDIPEGITVIKTPIREPYTLYKRFVGKKKDDSIKAGFLSEKKNPGLAEKISVWIRGNFFIPDARRFWIKPSIKFLTKYLTENPVDALVSTGPPHSMHLIALGVKKALNIPWLADFRDPWTNIDFYDKLMLTKSSDRKHKRLEKAVLSGADVRVTVSRNWAEDFHKLGAENVEVITNGFDPEDFEFAQSEPAKSFQLVHIGAMNGDRNPQLLWHVLGELCKSDPVFNKHLEIVFIGQTDWSVKQKIEENGLTSHVKMISYLPHDEVLVKASQAFLLLLPLNDTPNVEGIIPGKLFEYLAIKRPILCIGSKTGDSAHIIHETKAGTVVDFKDKESMKSAIENYYKNFTLGQRVHQPENARINNYSRKQLTGKMAGLLNQITA